MKLLGIYRAPRFSPNSQDRDAAILQAVATRLNAKHEVHLIEELQFMSSPVDRDIQGVFSMARHPESLTRLKELETKGIPVFNSAQGLLQLNRRLLAHTYRTLGLVAPQSFRNTDFPEALSRLTFPCWLKRDDQCAQQADDVRFIQNQPELLSALSAFRERQITDYVTESHIEGDLVKFYGVAGTKFFSFHYPNAMHSFSKFGLESHNGHTHRYPFDSHRFKHEIDSLATTLSIPIYGGDAIVQSDGTCHIIDFNDWPSFSSCKDDAAEAISQLIQVRLTE